MQKLVWFALGRLALSLIGSWSWKFFWTELAAVAVYLSGGWLLLRVGPPALQGLLIGGVFFVTAIASPLIARHNRISLRIGIVDFSWLFILAGTLAVVCFATSSYPVNDVSPSFGSLSHDFLQAELSNTIFLLGKTIDSALLLGGILAGGMAILWAGEIWRKESEKDRKEYSVRTHTAIRIVVAYLVVVISALYWVGVPLYTRMNNLSQLLK